MYKERMIGYYPPILSAILEFQAIIGAEYPEYERISTERDTVLNDAYLLTMDEERVLQWERILGITPLVNSTLQDRRDTIVARIRGQGKLNTEPLITHTYPLSRIAEAYALFENRQDGVIKVAVEC